jgi:hypothetical protein
MADETITEEKTEVKRREIRMVYLDFFPPICESGRCGVDLNGFLIDQSNESIFGVEGMRTDYTLWYQGKECWGFRRERVEIEGIEYDFEVTATDELKEFRRLMEENPDLIATDTEVLSRHKEYPQVLELARRTGQNIVDIPLRELVNDRHLYDFDKRQERLNERFYQPLAKELKRLSELARQAEEAK